jgi:hypothetical protein
LVALRRVIAASYGQDLADKLARHKDGDGVRLVQGAVSDAVVGASGGFMAEKR